ncbi:hypothetical protein BGZ93_006981 [Podila epicladia]
METPTSYGIPRAHGDTIPPCLSPSTYTATCLEPINVPRKSVSALNTCLSTSLDNSTLSESMSSPPRRPMSPTLGGAAAAMKKFLRRRRGTACKGDSQPPPRQHQPQNQRPSMLQSFVLVGGVGAESGTTIYDLDYVQPSPQPLSPYSSKVPHSPVAISVTKPQSHMVTPPTSPIHHTGINQSRIPTMILRTDRGRDIHRDLYISSNHCLSPPENKTPSAEHNSAVGHKDVLDSTPEVVQGKLRRSLSADSIVPPFQARSSSLHRDHNRRSTLGLNSAMELMLNEDSKDRSLMAKASSWEQDGRDDEGCMSAEISFSSLLATDLEMLDSLKNEHRQGGSGKRTIAKEKKKREQQQQQQHQQKSQQKQQQPQINSHRKKPTIYQASMDFLASYHGPTHTGQGEYSARYLKKAAEQGKHPADWSAIERFTSDLPSKNDTSGTRSRFASAASASSSTTLLVHTDDDSSILLVSTRPTPTQFYSALKTRKALRTLVTNSEQEFENMLERGFIWSPVSELVDPNNPDEDDVLEDQDQEFMIPSVSPQYFMTLRITLTPWHARADESEIYGHFAHKQAPTIAKKPSAYSLNSSISSSLSPAASATSLSLESSISSDFDTSAPSTPPPKETSPETECPFDKAIRTAPVILERSSSLLRSRKQIDRSAHASPKLTGRIFKTSSPSSSVPCHAFDARIHPLDRDSQDQPLPSRKGLLGPLSPPVPNTHGNSGKPISPPEKNKDRLRDFTRDSISISREVPRRKGSTPAIFYSPPGCNSNSGLLNEDQCPSVRLQSIAPRSLSMSATPRPRRTDYVAPSLRAAARQPSSIPIRKRSDQSNEMSANLAAARRIAEDERPSTRVIEAWRQKNLGRTSNPQINVRGSPAAKEHQRANELDGHLPSIRQQRLHSHDSPIASYASTLPVSKARQIFCGKPEGLTKYQMDYRDSSNYNLTSPASSLPTSHPHDQFWSSERKPSGGGDQVLDCHHAKYDNHRLARIPRYQVNESHVKSPPFTVSGVSIVPRSVHRDVVKVDRGFVITNNLRSNRSSPQDERGSEVTDVVTPASGFETTMNEEAATAAQEGGCWRPVQLCQTQVMQTFAFP